jgi:hypothetical protein
MRSRLFLLLTFAGIAFAAPTITTSALPNGQVSFAYDQTLAATGATGSITWSITNGAVPAGLSLATSGRISGTPTTAGTFTFSVRASAINGSDTQSLSIVVDPRLTITTTTLANGTVGQQYSDTLAATGGTGTKSWTRSGNLPAGLTLSAAGAITGTPTAAGTSTFTVTVTDSATRTASKQLSITIAAAAPPLTISTATLPNGAVGTGYSATLTATGGSGSYSWTRTGGSLPAGLSLATSGAITGTPTAAGAATFTVQVADTASHTASKQLSITIDPNAPSVTTASLPAGQIGQAYSQALQATGGSGGYTWSVSAGALPQGLSLAAGGTIAGTPAAAGTSNFTVTVRDSGARTGSKALSITVAAAPVTVTTSALPNGQVGVVYAYTVQASGGTGTYVWTVTTGSLPAGLVLAPTGALTGIPLSAGARTFTLTATDTAAHSGSKSLTLLVDPPGLSFTTASLPNGVAGTGYSATIEAAGGSGGNQFSVTSGSLPAGLSLDASGAISGTPSAAGASTFTVTVKDNGGRSASKDYTITIDPPPITFTTASLPNGIVGTGYSATVETTGGSGGKQFSVSSGSLPAGLSMNASGAISGTPTAAGNSTFTVTVKDNGGRTASKDYSIAVDPPALTITTTSLTGGVVGAPYSASVEASGGSGGNQFSVSGGALPAGLSMAASGAISGTPTAPGTATFTATVKDNGGRSASKQLSIAIDAPALTITTASLANAIAGTPYAASVEAAGGSGGNKFAVSAGNLPAGLSMTAAGAISGTATTVGTSNFTVTVTDNANKTASKGYTLTVEAPALVITTTALPSGTIGVAYSQALAATGGAGGNSWTVSAGALPAGLTLSAAGTISGTPTAPGPSSFTVQVKDSASTVTTKVFTLTVNPPALTIVTTSLPAAVQGTAYSQTLNATGGTGTYRWSIAAGALPIGLTLDATGHVTGTATGASSTFTVGVQDAGGSTANKNLSITVTPPLALPPATSLPTGVTGTTYSGTLKPSGGQPPYSFAVSSGQLPPGLALNAASGEISGRPTQVGSFNFAVQVKDATGAQTQSNYTVAIANTLTITNPPVLPGGSVGVPYQVALIAAGGTAPYSFSATAGSLPGGLNFRADGTIDGTPATAGTFAFTATVVDAVSGRTTKDFSLTIAGSLTITTGPQLPNGVTGSPYNAPLAATGGTPPYTWAIASGSLAAGLRLDSATGTITGVPETTGTSNFTASVTDSANVSVQKAFTVAVAAGVSFTSAATLPDAVAGTSYSFTFTATGGRAPYTWRISDGALPAGLALNATSGVVSGSPSESGTFNFTVEATDAAGLKATRVHTLVVNLPTVATFRISGVPATLGPLQQPQVAVVISNPYPVPITGRLNLVFTPATGMPDDPAVQFSTGGRSVTFTIAANDTQATFSVSRLLLQSGSVAGALQFTVESLRAGNDTLPNPTSPIGSAQIPASAAVVRTVEVLRSTDGFNLVVVGASTTRELTSMTVRFRPPAGATLQTTEVTVPLTDPAKGWFQGSGSAQYGGQFTITLPFTFVGGASSIESVGVTLTNSVGPSQETSGPY